VLSTPVMLSMESFPLRSMLGQFLCHASRKAPSLRKVLREKGHWPRSSVEGRLRVNIVVLIGCQVSANEHALRDLAPHLPQLSLDQAG
jgi:hypothetical protein